MAADGGTSGYRQGPIYGPSDMVLPETRPGGAGFAGQPSGDASATSRARRYTPSGEQPSKPAPEQGESEEDKRVGRLMMNAQPYKGDLGPFPPLREGRDRYEFLKTEQPERSEGRRKFPPLPAHQDRYEFLKAQDVAPAEQGAQGPSRDRATGAGGSGRWRAPPRRPAPGYGYPPAGYGRPAAAPGYVRGRPVPPPTRPRRDGGS